jgi:hypothetical protein
MQSLNFVPSLFPKMKDKLTNVITLTPLNPNVSLASQDIIKRALYPKDDKLLKIGKSNSFQKLLVSDASTEEGQDYIAK